MRSQIPFLAELRHELMSAAPDVATRKSKPPRRRGPAVAVAGFVLVLLVGALVGWLRDPGQLADPQDLIGWDLQVLLSAAERPEPVIAEIQAIAGVAETRYVPDASGVPHLEDEVGTLTGGLEDSTEPGHPSWFAAILLWLAEGADPEEVAVRLTQIDDIVAVSASPEIAARRLADMFTRAAEGATVVADQPLILQPSPGPELGFDPEVLGREIVLAPAQPGDDLTDVFENLSPSVSDTWDQTRPALHIGSVDEIQGRMLLLATEGDRFCLVFSGAVGDAQDCRDPASMHYGMAFGVGSGNEAQGFITIAVPEGTAAVAITANGGEQLWQRPVAGWAVFPGDPPLSSLLVEAYDAVGNQVGVWSR